MSRRFVIYSVLVVIAVVVLIRFLEPMVRRETTTIDFIVPDNYQGWLVVAWNCDGGIPFDDVKTADARYQITYDAAGTACIADTHPSPGYIVGEYQYASGAEASVLSGGTLIASQHYAATPTTGTPTPAQIRPASDMTYNLASIGIGGSNTLGDSCDLDRFLTEHFGEPESVRPCAPVPYYPPDDDETEVEAES